MQIFEKEISAHFLISQAVQKRHDKMELVNKLKFVPFSVCFVSFHKITGSSKKLQSWSRLRYLAWS